MYDEPCHYRIEPRVVRRAAESRRRRVSVMQVLSTLTIHHDSVLAIVLQQLMVARSGTAVGILSLGGFFPFKPAWLSSKFRWYVRQLLPTVLCPALL